MHSYVRHNRPHQTIYVATANERTGSRIFMNACSIDRGIQNRGRVDWHKSVANLNTRSREATPFAKACNYITSITWTMF